MISRTNLKPWLVISVSLILIVNSAVAVEWTGGGADDSWCTPNNWAGAVVPGFSDNAVIDTLPCAVIGPGCIADCNAITVGLTTYDVCLNITGGTLTVGTDFIIGDQASSTGTVTMTTGTMDVGGDLSIGKDGTGTVQLDGGTIQAGALAIGTSGSIDINEGTLIIDGYALDDVWGYADAGYLTGYSSSLRPLVVDYDVRNSGKTTVTATTTYDPDQAWNPRPSDTEIFVDPNVTLSWSSGDGVGLRGRHGVYFGTDYNAVNDANMSSPEYKGYTAWADYHSWNIGLLGFSKTYFWRIDEFNYLAGSIPITKGNVWSFTTRPIFVDAAATGANNGSSWEDAYKYLQDALADPCLTSGDSIWVVEGTYYPDANSANPGSGLRTDTFELINGVGIYGGFPSGGGTWQQRDLNAYQTILSGDLNGDDIGFTNNGENSYHVVTGSGTDATAVLDGFTITAGNADGSWPHIYGGGMHNDSGSPTVVNCTFTENQAKSWGGGMYNYSSSPVVANCWFIGNVANQGGGGICNVTDSSPEITNCIFSGNLGGYGGGMRNNSEGSNPTLTNCTFSGNSSIGTGGRGGGMYNNYCSPTVTNCILWGNRAPDGPQIRNNGTSSPVVTYCDIEGTSVWPGTGNINFDPLFKDADLSLLFNSPCIDAGDNNSVPADTADLDNDGNTVEPIPFDLAGNARFTDDPVVVDTGNPPGADAIVEMGAYERYEFCGSGVYLHPPGDISGPDGVRDCRVDFYDFTLMAAHWLEDVQPE